MRVHTAQFVGKNKNTQRQEIYECLNINYKCLNNSDVKLNTCNQWSLHSKPYMLVKFLCLIKLLMCFNQLCQLAMMFLMRVFANEEFLFLSGKAHVDLIAFANHGLVCQSIKDNKRRRSHKKRRNFELVTSFL